MQTDPTSQTAARRLRRRSPIVALAVVLTAVAAACSPAPGGGFNIAIGGTIPLPPIVSAPAFQGGNVLGCPIGFNTPGINITGATAKIPGINVNPGAGTVSIPNIEVNLPSIQVQLPAIVTCLGTLNLGTIKLPAHVVASGVLNLGTGQLTINANVEIPFSILGISFPINIPIGPIVVGL
jgi:hypothetical protein